MRLIRLPSIVFLSLFFCIPAESVRHIRPESYPNGGICKARGISAERMKAAGSNLRGTIIGTARGAKTVAVILVRFPSASSSITTLPNTNTAGAGTQNLIQSCTQINTYFTQMEQYFQEVSYNAIPSITFKYFGSNTGTVGGDNSACVSGSYDLGNAMEYYGCGDELSGCAASVPTPTPGVINANGNYLIRDALRAARLGHSNTPTARTSGGNFDAVIVMHAGNGNETTNSNGDIWSIFYSQDSVITSGGGGFTEGDVVPETQASGITSPLGVMCHEFGHELGLPDLYNTVAVGGTSVVGDWDLMDSGPFAGNGANPSHIGAWGKYYLGWATPQVVTTRASPTLGYVTQGAANMVKLPVANGSAQEYFLVEYRSRTSGATFDQRVPGEGLMIWHVDDDLTSTRGIYVTDQSLANTVNRGTPHYGVAIVPANGISISESNRGTAGNAFTTGSVFSSPRSDNFAGQASGISLVNIVTGASTASFDVVNLAVTAAQTIRKVINYPNPAGKGYAHTLGENHTTLQFQLSKPATEYEMNIYTLSGDLVKKIVKTDFRLKVDRSSDLKWVYEYDWNLKNGDGEMVAPGVYLILVRADGEKKTNKIVIIR